MSACTTNFVQSPGPWVLDYTDAGVQEGLVALDHVNLAYRMCGEGHVGLCEHGMPVGGWGWLGA